MVEVTSRLMLSREQSVINEVLDKGRDLRFTRLLPLLIPEANGRVNVVTPNYDRLIEVAAEVAGWGVDNLFVGSYMGLLDGEASR